MFDVLNFSLVAEVYFLNVLHSYVGYFVLLFLCKHQKTSVEFIVQKVSEMFTEICR